jgi:apolipoprotein D and lipocalin family protein
MKKLILLSLALPLLGGCAALQKGPIGNVAVPAPAKPVEIDREAVTAEYSLKKPGEIKVVNTCHAGGKTGKEKVARGKAKIVAGSDNAKLRVSFFGPFYGDYWVLDRADDYSWAIIGEPSGRYLWLLHRQAQPGSDALRKLSVRAAGLGYDMKMLRWTVQPG